MTAPSFDEIVAEYKQRKGTLHPAMEKMRELARIYKGDVVVPLPELDRSEKAGVANMIQQGLDQLGSRVASTMPDVWYPPTVPGAKRAEAYARIRRKATIGWWTTNKMRLKMRKRARHLIGYGTSPVMLRPDSKWEMPRWHIRDPLGTYPPLGLDPDDIVPPNCIFAFKRSLAWLSTFYPQVAGRLYKGPSPKDSDTYEFVEYADADVFVLGVLGAVRQPWDRGGDGLSTMVEISRVPNRIGMCPTVVPARIGLDLPMGQFDNVLGMYHWQARLMALELIAIERSVFPDTYLISRPNEIAGFIDGPHDGRTGRVNIVKGGDIREVTPQPNMQTNQASDRLERAQRITGGIPAEFGGESTSNIRTGRRGDSVLSAVVDFPVQEAQELLQESLSAENKIAVAIVRTYFDQPKSFYVNWKGIKGRVDYEPSVHFDSDVNFVTFSHPGADINNLVVGLGQRIGVGLISRRTAMSIDPFIEDAEYEHDQIVKEALEQSVLASLQQQSTTGAVPLPDIARIMELVSSNKAELVDALQQVQAEAQARQATPAPAGAPETQPGLAQPGAGAEQPAMGPAELQSLPALLAQLRGAPAITQTRATLT